jgi:hypothetical protein
MRYAQINRLMNKLLLLILIIGLLVGGATMGSAPNVLNLAVPKLGASEDITIVGCLIVHAGSGKCIQPNPVSLTFK